MIRYNTITTEIQTARTEITDDAVLTSAGSGLQFTVGLWLFSYIQILTYSTVNFLNFDPQFYFSLLSTTGAIQTIGAFSSNTSDPVFIIYPGVAISNGIDMAGGGALIFGWNGNAGYTPIGSQIIIKSYYINQPNLLI